MLPAKSVLVIYIYFLLSSFVPEVIHSSLPIMSSSTELWRVPQCTTTPKMKVSFAPVIQAAGGAAAKQ